MLDQMYAAGKLGNAELENLADIFARVGNNAKTAGLSFEGALAFIERMSLVERQPERLATLVDSTLRLFQQPDISGRGRARNGRKFLQCGRFPPGNVRCACRHAGTLQGKFQNGYGTGQGLFPGVRQDRS